MELLNRRFNFEEITKGYNCEPGSDIDSIEWFIENGHRSNSLRNGFDDALRGAGDISSLHYLHGAFWVDNNLNFWVPISSGFNLGNTESCVYRTMASPQYDPGPSNLFWG